MRLELTLAGLQINIANHYSTRGTLMQRCCLQEQTAEKKGNSALGILPPGNTFLLDSVAKNEVI